MTREDKRAYTYARNRLANDDYPVYSDEYELELAYKAGIEDAKNHPHWISVDELPKIGKDVLVLREDGEMQVAHQYNEEIARWWSVDGFPLKNNITHWMPLPQAPTEEIRGNQGKISPNLSNSLNIGKDLKGCEE